MKKTGVLPYLAGIVMACFFGLSFLFMKAGLAELPPMVLMSYRFGVAAIVLTILRLCKLIRIDYKDKPIGGVIALSIFYPGIAFFFEVLGLQYVSTSQAGILVSIMPIFVTGLGVLILHEHPQKIQIFFIILSVTGVLMTVIFARSSGDKSTVFGIILMLISIVGGSLNNVLSRKYSKYFTSIEITYMMICLGAVIFTFLSVAQGIFNREILLAYAKPFQSLKLMGVILQLSVCTSVVAFFCMNYMLSKLKAVNAAVFVNLATVISIVAGVIILREHLFWYQVVGGIFIIASVWGTNYWELKANSKGKEKEKKNGRT